MWTLMLLCLEQFEDLTGYNKQGQKKLFTFDKLLIKP